MGENTKQKRHYRRYMDTVIVCQDGCRVSSNKAEPSLMAFYVGTLNTVKNWGIMTALTVMYNIEPGV